MSFIETIGIALGLAMDAFAVAVVTSAVLKRVSTRQYFRLSFHFGLFQFLMPILGWLLGKTVAAQLNHYNRWGAFALLIFVGGKMIWGSLKSRGEKRLVEDPTRGLTLMMLSVATSIDALAVGVTFALLGIAVWYPAVVIGIVTAAITFLGMRLGGRIGARFSNGLEIVGGLVLIAIGIRIVI